MPASLGDKQVEAILGIAAAAAAAGTIVGPQIIVVDNFEDGPVADHANIPE